VVSRLGLVGTVGLGLGLVTFLGLALRVRVSISISGGGDKPGLPPQFIFMLLWQHLPSQKHHTLEYALRPHLLECFYVFLIIFFFCLCYLHISHRRQL